MKLASSNITKLGVAPASCHDKINTHSLTEFVDKYRAPQPHYFPIILQVISFSALLVSLFVLVSLQGKI